MCMDMHNKHNAFTELHSWLCHIPAMRHQGPITMWHHESSDADSKECKRAIAGKETVKYVVSYECVIGDDPIND
jgi:hypothetical protein